MQVWQNLFVHGQLRDFKTADSPQMKQASILAIVWSVFLPEGLLLHLCLEDWAMGPAGVLSNVASTAALFFVGSTIVA